MTKKCMYCKKEVDDDSVIDFCENCGVGVWGKKMFNTIVKNMEEAREKGDLVSTNTIGIQKLEKPWGKGF
ncbi:MAG: hypothetical protein AABX79_00130 [Nanoarchaeota archaeon]